MWIDPRQAAEVLSRYGLEDVRLEVLADLNCTVFRVDASGLPHAARSAVLKAYPVEKQDPAQVAREVAWLTALGESSALRVPRPLPDREGRIVQPVRGDAETRCVLYSWVEGAPLDAELEPERLRQVGAFVGEMHAHARRWAPRARPADGKVALARWTLSWIAETTQTPTALSPAEWQTVERAAARLAREADALGASERAYGFIHGDLYLSHFLFRDHDVGAVDFSDCAWGHWADDLATALVYLQHPIVGNADHSGRYDAFRDAFLSGYAERCALPDDVERAIELYVAVRLAVLVTVVGFIPTEVDLPPWVPACLRRCVALLEAWSG